MFMKVGIVKVTQESAEEVGRYLERKNFMKTITHGSPKKYAAAFMNTDTTKLVGLVLDSLKELDKKGADFAVIPCHQVHDPIVFRQIQEKSPMRLIHMINEVAEDCFLMNFSSVCFLGASKEIDLYGSPLRKMGISIVRPPQEDQDFLEIVCQAAEASGTVTRSGEVNIQEIFSKLKKVNQFDALAVTNPKLRNALHWSFTEICPIHPHYSLAVGACKHVQRHFESNL